MHAWNTLKLIIIIFGILSEVGEFRSSLFCLHFNLLTYLPRVCEHLSFWILYLNSWLIYLKFARGVLGVKTSKTESFVVILLSLLGSVGRLELAIPLVLYEYFLLYKFSSGKFYSETFTWCTPIWVINPFRRYGMGPKNPNPFQGLRPFLREKSKHF